MNPRDVVKYIEGEPKIGVVPTEPGLTNVNGERVVGMNMENTEINEGTINFDIVFYVRMKDGLSQIMVNVEAQKDMPTEYHILNRAIITKSIRFSLLYRYINRITNESVTILDKCSFYGFSCDIIKNACIKCLSGFPIWIG